MKPGAVAAYTQVGKLKPSSQKKFDQRRSGAEVQGPAASLHRLAAGVLGSVREFEGDIQGYTADCSPIRKLLGI